MGEVTRIDPASRALQAFGKHQHLRVLQRLDDLDFSPVDELVALYRTGELVPSEMIAALGLLLKHTAPVPKAIEIRDERDERPVAEIDADIQRLIASLLPRDLLG